MTIINLSIAIISFSFHLMYEKFNGFLKLQNRKYYVKKCLTQTQLAFKLSIFRREHHRITCMLIFATKTLFNKAISAILFLNFPLNICMLSLLILGKLPNKSKEFVLTSVVSESFALLLLLFMASTASSSIYTCKKYLVSLQSGLGIDQLRDKIHHQRFYEFVNYKHDIGFSISLFGVITNQKLYEVCATSYQIKNSFHWFLIFQFSSLYYTLVSYYISAKLLLAKVCYRN